MNSSDCSSDDAEENEVLVRVDDNVWSITASKPHHPPEPDNGLPPERLGMRPTPTNTTWSDWGIDRCGADNKHRPANLVNVALNKFMLTNGMPNLPKQYNDHFLACRPYLVHDHGRTINHPVLLNRVRNRFSV